MKPRHVRPPYAGPVCACGRPTFVNAECYGCYQASTDARDAAREIAKTHTAMTVRYRAVVEAAEGHTLVSGGRVYISPWRHYRQTAVALRLAALEANHGRNVVRASIETMINPEVDPC